MHDPTAHNVSSDRPRPLSRAVIPAAGRGTRLLPLSRAVPKELLPVADVPAIHLVVEEAVLSGVRDITIVTSPDKRAVEDYFAPWPEWVVMAAAAGRAPALVRLAALLEGVRIRFVHQPSPGGLGQAVALARPHVGDQPFAVLLPDVLVGPGSPCLARLVRLWRSSAGGETMVAAHRVAPQDVGRYGIIDPGAGRRAAGLVEKPDPERAPSRLALTGRYILHPDIFAALEETPPGAGGEVQLTDGLRRLLAHRPIFWAPVAGRVFDLGEVGGLLEANVVFGRRSPQLAGRVLQAAATPAVRRHPLPCRPRRLPLQRGSRWAPSPGL